LTTSIRFSSQSQVYLHLIVRHDFVLSFDGLPHREERLPVVLHIHDGPTLRRRLVEGFVELTDV
jgi:hypothetical protein